MAGELCVSSFLFTMSFPGQTRLTGSVREMSLILFLNEKAKRKPRQATLCSLTALLEGFAIWELLGLSP